MRVLIFALLVAGALSCSQTDYTDVCPDLNPGSTYVVSQVGPAPGATAVSTLLLPSGQADVRNGAAWDTAFASFAPTAANEKYTAPYTGCYYFLTAVRELVKGPICTKNAERLSNGQLNTRKAKAPKLQPFPAVTGIPSGTPPTYSFVLKFQIDSAHAGVAFEFLNLNVPTGTNAADVDTRCGVSFDNVVAPNADGSITSPHNKDLKILRPGTSTDNGIWNLARPLVNFDSNGFANVTYTIANFNTALVNCGWKRDETTPGTTFFRAQVRATTVSQGQSIRGVLYKKYEETVVSIAIAFNTFVQATSGTLNVNSPLVLFSEVTKQIFNPISKEAYLLLFTSSQGPYKLTTTGGACSSAASTDCNTWSTDTPPADPVEAFRPLAEADREVLNLFSGDVGFNGVTASGLSATCYSDATTATKPDYTAASAATWPACNQFWFMQIQGSIACGDITANSAVSQNLNGQWTVSFDIGCDSTYRGSCDIQATSTVANKTQITFSTSSDNYCPRVVDTVSSTASLAVYEDRERLTGQNQFVFGTTSYFSAQIVSSIKMQSVLTEEVAIIQGQANDNVEYLRGLTGLASPFTNPATALDSGSRQILYSNGFPAANDLFEAYFIAGLEAASAGVCTGRSERNKVASSSINTLSAGPPDAALSPITTNCYANNNIAGKPVLDWSITQFNATTSGAWQTTAYNYFQWYWNEATSSATGDFAQTTTVRWFGRIRYANQATKATKVGTWLAPHTALSAFDASSATVTNTVSGGPTSSTASGSSAAVSTTTIAVAAAAVAAIAVMAIAAFVVLRSRNAKMETETNLESVTLGTMGSSAQLSA